MTAVKSTKKS